MFGHTLPQDLAQVTCYSNCACVILEMLLSSKAFGPRMSLVAIAAMSLPGFQWTLALAVRSKPL